MYVEVVGTIPCLRDFNTPMRMKDLLMPLRYALGTTVQYRPRGSLSQAARDVRLAFANYYLSPLNLELRLETDHNISKVCMHLLSGPPVAAVVAPPAKPSHLAVPTVAAQAASPQASVEACMDMSAESSANLESAAFSAYIDEYISDETDLPLASAGDYFLSSVDAFDMYLASPTTTVSFLPPWALLECS